MSSIPPQPISTSETIQKARTAKPTSIGISARETAEKTTRAPMPVQAIRSPWDRLGGRRTGLSTGKRSRSHPILSPGGGIRPAQQVWIAPSPANTRIRGRQDPASYQRISELMATSPETILFISDAISELEAASNAGLQVLFSHRAGNPQQDPGPYPSLASFAALHG